MKLVAICGSLALSILSRELFCWIPSLTEVFVKFAVARLPEEHQERYEEEWRGHLAEIKGPLVALCVAFGFMVAGWSIASATSTLAATKSKARSGKLASRKQRVSNDRLIGRSAFWLAYTIADRLLRFSSRQLFASLLLLAMEQIHWICMSHEKLHSSLPHIPDVLLTFGLVWPMSVLLGFVPMERLSLWWNDRIPRR